MTKIIVITSGKGGVGKTSLTANLSVQLASQGFLPCVFDADLGLANINILFGIYTEKTIEDVIYHDVPLQDIIMKNYHGIDIIPGSSGVEKIADLEPEQTDKLIKSFSCLENYDYLFFDTSAGVARNVVSFCLSANVLTLVITSEPTSLTDGYALLKVLCLNGFSAPVKVVVNGCKNTNVAKNTYIKFRDVVKKYLSVDIQPLGFIVEDAKVKEAVERQKPFILLYPETSASKCIRAIAANLVKQKEEGFQNQTPDQFLKRFISLFSGRLHFKATEENQEKTDRHVENEPQSPAENISPKPSLAVSKEQFLTPSSIKDNGYDEKVSTDEPDKKDAVIKELTPDSAIKEKTEIQETEDNNELHIKQPLPKDENPFSYQNRQVFFNKLVESISSVSSEIKLMRESIASNGSGIIKSTKQSDEQLQNSVKKPIKLDFENYIPKRYLQQNEQKK